MEKNYQIALTLLPGIGPKLSRQLVSYCGGVQGVFEAREKELMKIPDIGKTLTKQILKSKDQALSLAEKELVKMEKHHINMSFYLDEHYPARLKPFEESPVVLFQAGPAELNVERTLAIVGTRKPTDYGKALTRDLVKSVKDLNVTIVSGMAYGIDSIAHRACLELGVPTVGALGHGLKYIYPADHLHLSKEMIDKGGLLSEFVFDTEIKKDHFPMRNRIIAGLSDATVVIETPQRGGSIITALFANEYQRDVFAFPGKTTDHNSKGCNHLIKTHKASLIESAEDIAYVMRWDKNKSGQKHVQKQLFPELSDSEKTIYNLIPEEGNIAIDHLIFKSQMSNSILAAILLELEMKGLIAGLPGKRFARV